ncbi:hypothetical protein FRC06_004135 [Ceratobasidium sp. 370]|nr:hypothetical protein FRC06_004135 [Ceratobasidium sp. 370]
MIPARPRTRTQSMGTTRSARPTSPTFSVTTNASDVRELAGRAERIITRADLRASADAYEHLLNASSKFREALGGVSQASAAFAEAVEKCSRLKGPSDACGKDLQVTLTFAPYLHCTRLPPLPYQAAAGLHHLISNHERILEHTIFHKFEAPLRQGFETYKSTVAARSTEYERALTEKSRIIRKTEADNMRVGRKKLRDLNSFRAALATLQAQVNDLDKLKSEYYQQVLEHEQNVWDGVLGNVSLVVRSTMDVYDRITAKASDASLEHILASVPDPFDEYTSQDSSSDAIFSILPPLDILAGTKTPTGESTAPGSAASSAGNITAPVSNPNSAQNLGGLNSAPASGNGLKTWLDGQNDWVEGASSSRRHSVPPLTGGGSGFGYPASQSQHFPYTVATSSPLASPPILAPINETHDYDQDEGPRHSQGSRLRETSASPVDEGGWASYAFPGRSNGSENGMSEAALDGTTPIASRFSISRSESGETERARAEDAESVLLYALTVVNPNAVCGSGHLGFES